MKTSWLSLALAACTAQLAAGGLVVQPNPALVRTGGTVDFTVESDSAQAPVEWQVVPPGLGAIDAGGRFTASGKTGQGLVRAVSASPGARAVGHAMVKVIGNDDIKLRVAVSPAVARTKVISPVQFLAEVTGLDGRGRNAPELSWRVVPKDLGTIDDQGLFRPQRPGRGRIVALARDGAASGMGQARIIIASSPGAGSLSVDIEPRRLRLEPGASAAVKVTVRDSSGNIVPAEVLFQVSPPGLGSFSAAGTFTASEGSGSGVMAVRAVHQGAFGQARGLIAVAGGARRYRVRLRPKTALVAPSQSTEFEPVCYDQQGNQATPPYWVWKVVPQGLGTITPEGLFTAGGRAAQGKIVASLPPEFGRGQDFASVRVKPGSAIMVRVSPAKALLKPGQSQQFTARVTDRQGRTLDVPGLAWRVFPAGLGSITPGGLLTAGQQAKIGTVVAIVPPESGGGRGVAAVGVSDYTVLVTGPRPRHLQAGEVHQFEAEVRDQAGNLVPGVSWEWSASSLSPNFGSIDPAAGVFTAGQPLLAQVEGNVFVRARLGGLVVGANGVHVYVHRR